MTSILFPHSYEVIAVTLVNDEHAPFQLKHKKVIDMRTSTNLYFDTSGLVDSARLREFLENDRTGHLALFSDGSAAAVDAMQQLDSNPDFDRSRFERISVVAPPLMAVQLTNADRKNSLPHFLYNEDDFDKWLTTKVAAPGIDLSVYDRTAADHKRILLSPDDTASMCFVCLKLWEAIRIGEDRLSFPAALIAALIPYSRMITRGRVDVNRLRVELGIDDIFYNPTDDIMTVFFGSVTATIKVGLLDEVFRVMLLPVYRQLDARRFGLTVTHRDSGSRTPENITHAALGMWVESLKASIKRTDISNSNPISLSDLVKLSKKARLDNDFCFAVGEGETVRDVVTKNISMLVRERRCDDSSREEQFGRY